MGAEYPRGLLPDPAGQAGKVLQVDSGDDPAWTDPVATLPPSGPASGVLSGDYPDPSFAVDMATQVELDAERVRAEGEEDLKLNIADGRVPPAPTASGLWLKDAGGGLAWTAITQGDVAGLSAALTARALASDLTAEASRAEAAEALLAPLTDAHLLGNPTAPTPSPGDNDTSVATSAFVQAALAVAIATASIPEADVAGLISDLAAKATLASPVFTGDPHTPDQSDADNDQSIANTKFVQRAIALLALGTASTHAATDFDAAGLAATEQARALAAETLLAPKASPALTGHPTGVTESPGDNSTRLASTAYADAIAALKLSLAGGTMTGDLEMGSHLLTGSKITIADTEANIFALTASSYTGVLAWASDTFVMFRSDGANWKPIMWNQGVQAEQAGMLATHPIRDISSQTLALSTSGTDFLGAIFYPRGQVVSNFKWRPGTTAPTWAVNNDGHWYNLIRKQDGSLMASSADGGHAGISASVPITNPITRDSANSAASNWTSPASDYYLVGVNIYLGSGGGGAMPTITGKGALTVTGINALGKIISATGQAGMTSGTPATAPGAPANGTLEPWFATT